MTGPSTSVIVRTYNSALTLRACLQSVLAQTTRPQIVVVDSGSCDSSLDIAAEYADVIVQLAPGEFTFGRALNRGIDVCTGEVIFALSSHVVAPGHDWIDLSLSHYRDARVLATCGGSLDADGQPLRLVSRLDRTDVRSSMRWGLSNTAASWRADAVRRFPFDEDLAACEDKEWTFRALQGSDVLVVDPALGVDSSHRKRKGPASYFARMFSEHVALLQFGAQRPQGPVRTLADWWTSSANPPPGYRGFTSWTRAVEALARLAAERHFGAAHAQQYALTRKFPILSTIWDESDDAWNAAVDVADRRRRPWLAFVVETALRARSYRAIVVLGSLGRSDLYQDLAIALLVRRLTHPGARLVITDCTWEPGSATLASGSKILGRLLAGGHRLLVKFVDGPRTIFCVLSEHERAIFPTTWGVDPDRVVVTPFFYTLPADGVNSSSEEYIFAGGDSQRDYSLLVEAAGKMEEEFLIATRQEVGRVPGNVRVRAMTHADYVEAMRGARIVVVPMLNNAFRSAGQQTYLNAMLLGKPVVVTHVPWLEAISDGVNGVVAPAEAGALSNALHQIFHADPAVRSTMGERARLTVLSSFTPEIYRQRLVALAKGEYFGL